MLDSKTSINGNGIIETTAMNESSKLERECRVYKKRWLMLSIFILFTFTNSLQWGQYVIIADKVMQYYNVTGSAVDWTMQVYMAAYIILIFPALWLLDKLGIRFCLILSCGGLTLGAWIKVFASLRPTLFLHVLLGQMTNAIFQVLIFGLAARVTAVWFGSNEVSFACSLAVFGDQMGSALGFLLPGEIVSGTGPIIATQLTILNLVIAGFSTVIFISALLFFKDRPKIPPSYAQMLQKKSDNDDIIMGVTKTFKSKSFIAMMVAYGINVAAFNTYIALFNSTFIKHFPDEHDHKHIGRITTLIMLSGIVGSLLMGYILDRTHLFKGMTVMVYLFSFLSKLLNVYMFKLENLILVYVSNTLIGFFQIGYYSIAIQLAIEMTYPISEGFSSSVLLLTSHILGILFGQVYRIVYDDKGDMVANLGLTFLLLVGSLLTLTIPPKMKRYKTQKLGANQLEFL